MGGAGAEAWPKTQGHPGGAAPQGGEGKEAFGDNAKVSLCCCERVGRNHWGSLFVFVFFLRTVVRLLAEADTNPLPCAALGKSARTRRLSASNVQIASPTAEPEDGPAVRPASVSLVSRAAPPPAPRALSCMSQLGRQVEQLTRTVSARLAPPKQLPGAASTGVKPTFLLECSWEQGSGPGWRLQPQFHLNTPAELPGSPPEMQILVFHTTWQLSQVCVASCRQATEALP